MAEDTSIVPHASQTRFRSFATFKFQAERNQAPPALGLVSFQELEKVLRSVAVAASGPHAWAVDIATIEAPPTVAAIAIPHSMRVPALAHHRHYQSTSRSPSVKRERGTREKKVQIYTWTCPKITGAESGAILATSALEFAIPDLTA